jgi:hypothetical protein
VLAGLRRNGLVDLDGFESYPRCDLGREEQEFEFILNYGVGAWVG